jgi:hypothetical protein
VTVTAQLAPVPVVVRDVFPAEVAVGGNVYRSARAVITRDRLLVYLTTAGPVVDTPYDRELSAVAPLNAPRSRASHLTLADGRPAHVNGQRGCGCGNPLKGWTPWQPYRKQAS